jgi:hypothetical protein
VRSIQVQDGDIAVKQGSLQFVTGSNKLAQQLTLWIQEPLEGNPLRGPGFTTPSFGSILSNFVGQTNTNLVQSQVKSEIFRILGVYQQNQFLQLQKAQTIAGLSNWSTSEIIKNIISVEIIPSNFSITANVFIQTLSNAKIALNVYIGQNGVTVS